MPPMQVIITIPPIDFPGETSNVIARYGWVSGSVYTLYLHACQRQRRTYL